MHEEYEKLSLEDKVIVTKNVYNKIYHRQEYKISLNHVKKFILRQQRDIEILKLQLQKCKEH